MEDFSFFIVRVIGMLRFHTTSRVDFYSGLQHFHIVVVLKMLLPVSVTF